MPAPRQTVLNNAGQFVAGACIWTYVAGTTTAAQTFTDQTGGTPNANPIIADSAGRFVAYLTPGSSYKFQYENTPCSSGSHGTILFTQDNIAAVNAPGNNTAIIGTAAQTLNAGTCAYLSDGGGGRTSGQFYPCDTANTYSATTVTVGMVPAQIASGATGQIILDGYVTGLSSLTVGATYYVGASGAISTTVPSNLRRIGQADTATSLVLTANPPPDSIVWQDFSGSSSITGWTSFTTKSIYYKRIGNAVFVAFNLQGTSNATSVTFSLPYALNATNPFVDIPIRSQDNATSVTGYCELAASSTAVNCYTTYAAAGWTASGTKIVVGQFFFQP